MANSRVPAPRRWQADSAGLHFPPGILVSFQRFIASAEAGPSDVPPSLGALEPKSDRAGRFLIALRRNEQLWIGILRDQSAPALRARAGSGEALICADSFVLDSKRPVPAGMTVIAAACDEKGARLPFSLAGCRLLQFAVESDVAMVELVDSGTFRRRSGAPAPPFARSDHGYGGWRLP